MKIIEATKSDYNQACSLYKGLDYHHANIAPERVQLYSDISRSEEQFSGYIKGDDRVLFLAIENGCAVGLVNLRIEIVPSKLMHVGRNYALLDNIYVKENSRNKGIATALIEAGKIWCKEKSVSKIELQVYSANKEAIALYKANGFSQYMVRLELETNA